MWSLSCKFYLWSLSKDTYNYEAMHGEQELGGTSNWFSIVQRLGVVRFFDQKDTTVCNAGTERGLQRCDCLHMHTRARVHTHTRTHTHTCVGESQELIMSQTNESCHIFKPSTSKFLKTKIEHMNSYKHSLFSILFDFYKENSENGA